MNDADKQWIDILQLPNCFGSGYVDSTPSHDTVNSSLWNCTNPSNTSNQTEQNGMNGFEFYKTEQLTFLWLLFAFIVIGNSAVLVALSLSKTKKSRMNFFIVQLAIADLLVGLISVLTDIIWKTTIDWHAGHFACKLIRYLQVVVTFSSTYVLVALSIDRFDAITRPMNFSGSGKRARILTGIAWMLSFLFSTPILVFYEERYVNRSYQCWIDFSEPWHWKLYLTIVAVVLFIIPAIIITTCYSVIIVTIWSKGKILTYQKSTKNSNWASHKDSKHSKDCLSTVEHESKRASSRGLIPRAKIKTIKMTLVIVLVFICCWSPYFIYDLLDVYGHIQATPHKIAIATFIQSMAPLNSAANPIIYCLFSTNICRNLRRIPFCNLLAQKLCCCFPSMRRPLRRRSTTATEYTSMTEATITKTSTRRYSGIPSTNLVLTAQQNSLLLKHVKDVEIYDDADKETAQL